MKVKDIRFKITDKNGNSIVVGFDDFYGADDYDVFINPGVENFDSFKPDCVSNYLGLTKDFAECDIEVIQ